MFYNYDKLKGRIKEKFGTNRAFAAAVGRSERSVSLKLNSLVPWTQTEIEASCEALDIPYTDISAYFFAKQVQRH
ncbi:MAG: DUF739 family protein [Clostridia bacterium]|nr:DUF739 family protein [Clostridia bacterium]